VLTLRFEQLELADGRQIPISAELVQQGESEKGRDTAKILGGAAAGAIVGHEVKKNRTGSIVGGLLRWSGGCCGREEHWHGSRACRWLDADHHARSGIPDCQQLNPGTVSGEGSPECFWLRSA
jgi:hypothetical protein